MIAAMFTFRILLKLYDPSKVKLTFQGGCQHFPIHHAIGMKRMCSVLKHSLSYSIFQQ